MSSNSDRQRWAVSVSEGRRFKDIADSQSCNESRALSLMSAMEVNSGTANKKTAAKAVSQ